MSYRIVWNHKTTKYQVVKTSFLTSSRFLAGTLRLTQSGDDYRQEFPIVYDAIEFLLRRGVPERFIESQGYVFDILKQKIEREKKPIKRMVQQENRHVNDEFTQFYAVWTKPINTHPNSRAPLRRTFDSKQTAQQALVDMSTRIPGKKFFLFKAVARAKDGVIVDLSTTNRKEKLLKKVQSLLDGNCNSAGEMRIFNSDLYEKLKKLIEEA